MALRDKLRAAAAPYLNPDETVEVVIPAQTASQYLVALGGVALFLGLNRYRLLVVTQQRILVLDTGKWGFKKPRSVLTELPRATQLGAPSGVWHVIPVGTEKLRVHRRFFNDLKQADAAVNAG